mmetsp:Transcript_18948/g.13747  ORF Transcript_18948/g.13747 Transcript_18948/m.13747 type:complete len:84 (-) Transcript_18948:178-429(-)
MNSDSELTKASFTNGKVNPLTSLSQITELHKAMSTIIKKDVRTNIDEQLLHGIASKGSSSLHESTFKKEGPRKKESKLKKSVV